MKQIYKLFNPLGEIAPDSWGSQLQCPVCSCEYTHFAPPILKKNDNYEAWEGRGSAIKIPMYCEFGHEWEIVIGFHKGWCFMGIDNEKKMNEYNTEKYL